MAHIDPRVLKALRDRKGWSQDELANRARVNKQTVYRLEHGAHARPRELTIQRLADALKTKPEVLTGSEPLSAETPGPSIFAPAELRTQMSAETRNALTLVATKYGVGQRRIVELAPYLFAWACEASLHRRAERISAIEGSYKAVAAHSGGFPHLSYLLTDNWRGEEIIGAEQESIEKRDIFGDLIPFNDGEVGNADADEWAENPLAVFLRDLSRDLGGDSSFDGFDRNTSPDYEVCRDVALQIVGGDEFAAEVILSGGARLHEMPQEARRGSAADRAAWAKSEHERRDAEFRALFPEGLVQLEDLVEGAAR